MASLRRLLCYTYPYLTSNETSGTKLRAKINGDPLSGAIDGANKLAVRKSAVGHGNYFDRSTIASILCLSLSTIPIIPVRVVKEAEYTHRLA